MLPVVSHGEYAEGTDRQTDGRTLDRYITLPAIDAASVIKGSSIAERPAMLFVSGHIMSVAVISRFRDIIAYLPKF